mmetsp:Transcript_14748/g.41785  ORF Transcript_14748/g.41785 Transcript_14748/m.41785 type:complete len:213 (+) Transcript_14748:233-871(+)
MVLLPIGPWSDAGCSGWCWCCSCCWRYPAPPAPAPGRRARQKSHRGTSAPALTAGAAPPGRSSAPCSRWLATSCAAWRSARAPRASTRPRLASSSMAPGQSLRALNTGSRPASHRPSRYASAAGPRSRSPHGPRCRATPSISRSSRSLSCATTRSKHSTCSHSAAPRPWQTRGPSRGSPSQWTGCASFAVRSSPAPAAAKTTSTPAPARPSR